MLISFPTVTAARPAQGAYSRQRGVTLIELLVVLVIIAILATQVLPNFLDAPDRARVTKAKQDIRAIENALLIYKLDNFTYPSSLEALVSKPGDAPNWKEGGYLKRVPKDPWGREYQFRNPGSKGGDVDIYSFGADGAEGGSGTDADVGNWDIDG